MRRREVAGKHHGLQMARAPLAMHLCLLPAIVHASLVHRHCLHNVRILAYKRWSPTRRWTSLWWAPASLVCHCWPAGPRGKKAAVLEQHYEIGCAHEFCVGLDGNTIPTTVLAKKPDTPVFRFEAGPSLYSGLRPPSRRIHPSTSSR